MMLGKREFPKSEKRKVRPLSSTVNGKTGFEITPLAKEKREQNPRMEEI
jgi:hypothetical protein